MLTGIKSRRPAIGTLLVHVLLVVVCGCGSFHAGVPDAFVGQWTCEELASDGKTDTGFYELYIEEDGFFSLYDAAAGNPGISGQMGNDTGSRIECRFDTDDFDVPYCWDIKSAKDVLEYELNADTLKLGHNDAWMTFHRVRDEGICVPVPESLDELIAFDLPPGFQLDMEYPCYGEDGQPIVQKGYASERDGYFSAAILSYRGYDCMSDVSQKIDIDECIDSLSRPRQIKIDGTTCYIGTIESDDMPDMVAVAYLPLDDYVFEFRLSNYDEQLTDEQAEAFETILWSVRDSDQCVRP